MLDPEDAITIETFPVAKATYGLAVAAPFAGRPTIVGSNGAYFHQVRRTSEGWWRLQSEQTLFPPAEPEQPHVELISQEAPIVDDSGPYLAFSEEERQHAAPMAGLAMARREHTLDLFARADTGAVIWGRGLADEYSMMRLPAPE